MATKRQARQWTAEAWRVRALELCEQSTLLHTPRSRGADGQGIEVYTVPTRTRQGHEHVVRYQAATGTTQCDCVAGSYGAPCCHAGAVLAAVAQRTQACSPAAAAATRDYQTWCAWFERQGA